MSEQTSSQTPTEPKTAEQRRRDVRRTLRNSVLTVVAMGALSFAAVPFYNYICRVTGFAGTTQRAESAPGAVEDRYVTVRFDASTQRDFPWEFKPVEQSMRVKIGESNMAFYRATNTSDHAITGTATFNVAPFDMGGYFSKIECFCFTEQTLQPGETVDMPVTFFLDPEMLEDIETKDITTVTLSYTFYETEKTAAVAAD